MVVYILLGEYEYGGGCSNSIIAVKETQEECRDIADKVKIDDWDSLIIQEWTELGCNSEIIVR